MAEPSAGRAVRTRLRVLAISESPLYGGAEAFFVRVVGDLCASGACEVTCAAPPENERLTAELRGLPATGVLPIPALPIRLAGVRLHGPLRHRVVRAALEGAQADVALLNMPSPEHGASALLAGVAATRRAVGLLHIPHSPREMRTRLGVVRTSLAPAATRRLAAICVLSAGGAELTRRLWARPGAAVEVVPLPRPVVRRTDADQARRQLGLGEDPLIGLAGRVETGQKGHDVLVDAARLLIDRWSGATPLPRFVIAGTGPDERRLRALIESHGLADRFTFLGRVTPIDPFLSAVDAIAMPSNFEGVPLIALEALAARTPGIASAIPGLGDVWPEVWQVPRGDAGALADGLARLLRTSDAARGAILDAAERAAERFLSDEPGTPILRILQTVAEGSRDG